MPESDHLPNSISYKQLDSLLKTAKQVANNSGRENNTLSSEEEAFLNLLISWSTVSKELIEKLRQKNSNIFHQKAPKSLMALGALEVHLNMAVEAHKAWNNQIN